MNAGKHTPYMAEMLVAVAMFFYGISFVATKIALEVYNPITIVTMRNIISGVLLLTVLLIKEGRKGLPRRAHVKVLLLVAFFQPFIYFLGETYGISMVEASVASIIIATIPVFSPLIVRFFYDEGLSKYNYIGLICSFIGVALIIFSSRDVHGAAVRPLGIVLLFIAVLAAVGYSIVVKKSPSYLSALSITSMQNCMGALLFIPFFLVFGLEETSAASPSFWPVASIIFLAVFPSSVSFLFMNYGIRKIGPTRTLVFANLVPAVTAVSSFIILDEVFTSMKLLGMAVILAGVILSQKKRVHIEEQIIPR